MSASRLQKLLKLLESNNESTRKAASKQICDIAKAHPSQLVSITRKVHALLYHSNWETRVAAAATVGGLADAFPHQSVQDLAAACSTPANASQQALYQVDVPLASFDLDKVLRKGQPLLASGGQEYDTAGDSSLPLSERVAKQRQMLRERLGLGKGMEGKAFDDIINTDELVNEDDLAAALTAPTPKAQASAARAARAANRQRSATPEKQQASELLRSESMSARERNKLKRKHKALQRQDSMKTDAQARAAGIKACAHEDSPNSPKLGKAGGSITPQSAAAAAAGTVLSDEQAAEQDEAEWQAIECGSWPFQRLADQLCNDILSPVWIVRHGAAAGLRELLREQAAAAAVEAPLLDSTSGWASPGGVGLRRLGVVLPDTLEQASAANAAWLEDVIEHLLCVLALDRFADYVSDQVVVPVRETAAQALGAALQPTSLSTLQRVLELLSSMHKHQEWSVRHGAFTGIKYLLASRPEVSGVLLPAALPVLLSGLTDKDDSVQAAAAEALAPMAPLLLAPEYEQVVDKLRDILWKLLSSMEEELSVVTSSSLSLLAALYSPPAHFTADVALSSQLPVLWPFLLHNMSSVRMAAAISIERLATAGSDPAYAAALGPEAPGPGAWLQPVAGPCLRLMLQCLMTERDARVQQGLLRAWSSLLEQVEAADLAAGLTVHDLRAMLNMIATPCGHALDTSQLVIPYQGRLVPWGSDVAEEAGFSARPAKKLKVKDDSSQSLSGMSSQAQGAGSGAGRLSLDPEAWPGMEDQEPAVKSRLVASRVMAQLCCKLQGQEPPIIPGLLYQQVQQPAASSRMASSLVILHWLQLVAAKCRDAVAAAAVKAEPTQATLAAIKLEVVGAAVFNLDQGSAAIKADPNVAVKADPSAAAKLDTATDIPAVVEPSALTTVALSAAICAEVPEVLPDTCLAYLGAPGASMPSPPTADPYSELAPLYARMRRDLYALVNASLQVGFMLTLPSGIPIEQVSSEGAIAMAAVVPPEADVGDVAAAKAALLQSASHVQLMEAYLHTSACLVLASTVVASGRLPAKLNTVIQNLMAGLRKEPVVALQEVAATAVAELMAGVAVRQPCPNEKLVKNLCSMVCGDPFETPSAAAAEGAGYEDDVQSSKLLCPTQSINSAQGNSTQPAVTQAAPAPDPAAATARVGAECALKAMCQRFGPGLFQQLPSLWLQMSAALGAAVGVDGAPAGDAQGLISAMQVVKAVVPSLHPSLVPLGLQLLPQLCGCLRHANAAVRLAAARCLAALAAAQAETVLPLLLKQVVPLLGGTNPVPSRLGAVEVMAQLVTQLRRQLVSYTVLLVVPLLRRMSDPVAAVRRKAALCFGSLTALLPLAQGLPLPDGLDEDQRQCAEQDGEFLSQLLDNRKVEDYCLPLKLKVELRRYQQEGINWLSFLRRFGLNGVLADDMGLGKTLQATAIIACSVAERQAVTAAPAAKQQQEPQQQQQQGSADDNSNHVAAKAAVSEQRKPPITLPSLVVCPSTLVGHWAHEINKYVDESVLTPLAISGSPSERAAAAKQLKKGGCNVVIISYEALRSDAEWAAGIEWDYVILDEGHVIRSTKSKLAQAVKRLSAQHRLVLSGTPIQNSALELWSLFDFLMPGFLGGEREFNSRFGRVVNAARYSKKGSKEAEAGTLALDALHKQVMPFILRRTKAQVLQDLPPKIVTDVLCKLSPIQQQLYEDFSSSQALSEVTGVLKQQQQAAGDGSSSKAAGEGSTGERHVFSALIYLRKLCSHPLLALDWSVPAHRDACQEVLGASTQPAAEAALRAIEYAPKLLALQDILVQCGLVSSDQILGTSGHKSSAAAAAELELSEGSSDSGHRLLVFAQLKGMLDLAESCLLKPLGISTLRLDGSIDASARFSVVQRFNTDPTIQVLLLTTHVGGLGLNLTSADTVVFLEHDWNPMKDLQAMDRAHRIGQTRTVNVYRLLMQDTLEERIMSLQQFKLDVANAVVNQDNVSMSAMDTGQLLDLFAAPTAAADKQQQEDQQKQQVAAAISVEDAQAAADGLGAAAPAGKKKSALQTMLDGMGDLWDESQYQSEFDMKGFMQKLSKKQSQQ